MILGIIKLKKQFRMSPVSEKKKLLKDISAKYSILTVNKPDNSRLGPSSFLLNSDTESAN